MKRPRRLPAVYSAALAFGATVAAAVVLAGCSGGESPGNGGGLSTPDVVLATPTAPAPERTPGVFDDRIVFGQSAAFTGPAQELGKNMRLGIQAAFQEVNERGGVHSRTLELTSLDDGYEPEAAAINTRHLIEEQDVFALIGAVGTPTSRAAAPVAEEHGVPYIGPFTGAAFLRDAERLSTVINLRASYNQETEEMVARLTEDLGITRIAVMYQDDSFGRAGYNGAQSALQRRGMVPAAIGIYPRNTTSVKSALLDLRDGNPEAVIIVGAYEPVAALIAWARHTGFDPVFITISFVGSNALARELGPAGPGVFVTQVVPSPTDESNPTAAAYLRALKAYAVGAAPGFVSFEGYLAARLAIASLERCGREVSRACLSESLHRAEMLDLDGFELRYDHDGDNQGSDTVFLSVIGDDGRYHTIETLRDAGR